MKADDYSTVYVGLPTLTVMSEIHGDLAIAPLSGTATQPCSSNPWKG